MTLDALTDRVGDLAEAVVADWRWVPDDLNVSVLGMLLYGLALETGHAMGLTVAEVDAAVLRCMTERVGAAAKWSGGLIAEANAAARSEDHHPGHHELIGVGRSYQAVADGRALVDNVYANFGSVRRHAGLPELTVPVFLNPLAVLLAEREKQKGAPLTEPEVVDVRDTAACTFMPLSQAEQFYASLDAQMPIPRLHPERLWEQWQSLRQHLG